MWKDKPLRLSDFPVNGWLEVTSNAGLRVEEEEVRMVLEAGKVT